ncbi:hypothetical protein [Labedaea rhizosphaerae]|uniref:Alanine-rich protein n=1 Tax=Labedaea rhizosphaerae TaxID=598644 RepID=A0A4R6SD32_LABRH|nr:hypothetical protein [Labedaea rhizosphaerae]TDP97832.1 hypothetical protein EV186_103809 [Labedaea rhizosphaerae]
MLVTGYAYGWDVQETGFVERVRELGVAEVAVATSYHATRAATPWSPDHTTVMAPHGAFYRPVRDEVWGALRPRAANWMPEDIAGDAIRTLNEAGIPAAAWVVLTHNSLLGELNPGLAVQNCFGERYRWGLCPSHPEVQEYSASVVAESLRDVDVASVILESCGQMGCAHHNHHEKTDAVWSPAAMRLLSICCCPSCVDDPATLRALRDEVRRLIATGDLTATEDQLPPALTEELLATRHRATDTLRKAVLSVVPQGVRTVLHGSVDPWVTGALPGFTPSAASDVDAVVLPGWAVGQASVDTVATARATLGDTTIGSYITAVAANPVPDIAGYVGDLAGAGADELHLYHLGLAGPARWADMRTAVQAAQAAGRS